MLPFIRREISPLQVLSSVGKGCPGRAPRCPSWGNSRSHRLFWVSALGTASTLHSFIHTKYPANIPAESWLVSLEHRKMLRASSVRCSLRALRGRCATHARPWVRKRCWGSARFSSRGRRSWREDLHLGRAFESPSAPILTVLGFNSAVTACWKTDVHVLTNTDTWKFPSKLREEANLFLLYIRALQHHERQR